MGALALLVVLTMSAVPAVADTGSQPEPGPLFDVEAAKFGRFLDKDPPEMAWRWEGFMPHGVVGCLAGTGGVGKDHLLIQAGISTATGAPFLGFATGDPGGFLLMAAEEDENELHRRGRRILDSFRQLHGWEDIHEAAVAERLHIVPRVGEDNLLTRRLNDGSVHITALAEGIAEAASRIPNLRVIALSPIGRFRGGKANDEEDTTRFVEALERLSKTTGATIIVTAHVNQAGIREGGGAEIVRGSTSLGDSVRWLATLQRLRPERASHYGLDSDEASRYLRLEVPKSNYSAEFSGLWLRREAGGVLMPAELEEHAPARGTEARYQEILVNLQALLDREGPLTPNAIETGFSGVQGVLGAGATDVRGTIQKAVLRGDLEERKNTGRGGGKLVCLPGSEGGR